MFLRAGRTAANALRAQSILRRSGWVHVTKRMTSGGRLGGMMKATKVEDVLKDPDWPKEWPFSSFNFRREDESPDAKFYEDPRFCFHIDNFAVSALTKYYDSLPAPHSVLDFASSWVSHYPEKWTKTASRIAVLGMSEEELSRNEIATERTVKDLNIDPTLPYDDNSFDIVTNCVSIDYLVKPLEITKEVCRVLKPGGRAIFSFSNRCFPTKVIQIWLQTNDLEHCFIVGCYFHYAGGFDAPEAIDISPPSFGMTDPMYVVTACKRAAPDESGASAS